MNVGVQVREQTTVRLPRFGAFAYAPRDVFEFPWGLPGFPALHRWVAVVRSSQPDVVWLQSLDDLRVALPTCDPSRAFADYDPALPSYATTALEIASPDDFTLLCVLADASADPASVNLLAPIAINLRTRRGRQIMLDDPAHSAKEAVRRRSSQ